MNKCNINIPHTPSTGLNGTRFSTLNSAGINDPEGPEAMNKKRINFNNVTFQYKILKYLKLIKKEKY
jgi:hypothetical protein